MSKKWCYRVSNLAPFGCLRIRRYDHYRTSRPHHFAFAIAEPLTFIFNESIANGIVPNIWKKANITPLAKIHPPKCMENDIRPISLTCTLSKLLESITGKWVLEAISSKIDPK